MPMTQILNKYSFIITEFVLNFKKSSRDILLHIKIFHLNENIRDVYGKI